MLLLPNSQVAENKVEICLGKTAEHIFFLQKSQLISTQNKRLQVKEMHVACCIHAAYLATVLLELSLDQGSGRLEHNHVHSLTCL